jgi:hypothetical protein
MTRPGLFRVTTAKGMVGQWEFAEGSEPNRMDGEEEEPV